MCFHIVFLNVLLPFFAVPIVLLLLFVTFIFFQASQDAQKQQICSASSSTQDSECVVTKDGQQICGHDDIRELCKELTIGFYLIIMGSVLMAVAQVMLLCCRNNIIQIMFITTACLRRAQLREDARFDRYRRLQSSFELEEH